MADESRGNAFANDGSFMEMFRRLQEQQKTPDGPSISERGEEGSVSTSSSGKSGSEVSNQRRVECGSSQRTGQLTTHASNEKDKVKEKGRTEKAEPKKYPPQIKSSQVAECSLTKPAYIHIY